MATGNAKLIIAKSNRMATPIAIGTNIIVLIVLDCINKALKTMTPVKITYNNQNGVFTPSPYESKNAFTEMEGKSVTLKPAPKV